MATMPAAVQAATSAPGADRTVSESRVDRDSQFNGLFQTKQNLRIEGVAEGEIQCEGMVTVAEGARVKAKVTASSVTIAGELGGEVICRDVFQIMPTGQVEATVSARRLIVQEGGFYNGEFHMITEAPPPMSSGRPTFSGRSPSREKSGEQASNEAMSTDEWWSKLANEDSAGGKPADGPDDGKKKGR